jgi:putative nucleotidyltransferase with HDIG domain
MISPEQAIALLRAYALPEARIAHSIGVADFAFDLASRIKQRHPELTLDPDKVRIGGILHDIGRARPGDHEINSVAILNEEGHPEIAAIVIHGSIYEIMQIRGIDDRSLLPTTIENKIVAYADARFRLGIVTLKERTDEILSRRSGESEKVAAIQMAAPRFEELERELARLTE